MNSLPIKNGLGAADNLAATSLPQGEATHHILGTNDLCIDAWGRQKVVNDLTLFSGMWSFNVPNRQWVAYHMDVTAPQLGFIEVGAIPTDNTGSHVKSINGMLKVSSDSDYQIHLQSKRHMRYQPNKGYLYSTAVILPDPTNALYTRHFGVMGGSRNGLYFELIGNGSDYTLNAVRRRFIDGVIQEFATDITSFLPDGFDMSKGHVYDIQAQWRGVGDIKFFIDLQLVHTENLLGTLDAMSVSNPSFHVGWSCFGDGATIYAGCVDVTSEGGHQEQKLYTTATTGTEMIACRKDGGNPTAILAVKIPKEITYNGDITDYTRDLLLTRMTPFCRDEAVISVWYGRAANTTNLDAVSLFTRAHDSYWEYAVESAATDELDIAFQLDMSEMDNRYSVRIEKDLPVFISMSGEDIMDHYLTTGDIVVFAFEPEGTSQLAGMTLEMGEDV